MLRLALLILTLPPPALVALLVSGLSVVI